MDPSRLDHRPPRRAVVVGAGIVGLSVAWHLQHHGVEVVVVERDHVAAGASWGNAGWLSPGLVSPLPEPSVLRYGLRALLDPASAIYVPLGLDHRSWSFLVRFVRHCTHASWRRAMAAYVDVDAHALDAYDELTDAGVGTPIASPVVAAFADRSAMVPLAREIRLLAEAGQHIDVTELTTDGARALAPHLSDRVVCAVRIDGQRYVDPCGYVTALADAVVGRGGGIVTADVASVRRHGGQVALASPGHEPVHGDVAVLATGAWLDDLVGPLGIRTSVRAGRGYSFTVNVEGQVPCLVYLPAARVACTPYRGALRIGGGMELRHPGAPLDPRRIEAIVRSVRPLLRGIDWSSIRDRWVGSRPITADGLPVIGPTAVPGIYVAGGHGMWGMTLGPVTGRLLAEQIVTGRRHPLLAPFDPMR